MAKTTTQRLRETYERFTKVGGHVTMDGNLIGDLKELLSGGCLDQAGLSSLASNMDDLALIAAGLQVPGAFRPDDIPEGASPTLKIKCGDDHRFDWEWE